MELINGLGGAFIFSENPKILAEWYSENLGFQFEGDESFGAFYQTFFSLDQKNPDKKLDTTFSIIKSKRKFNTEIPEIEPESMYGDQQFMVNLRTDDLDNLISHLESKNVKVLKRQDESYGKFAWIRDLDGNRIELDEPL